MVHSPFKVDGFLPQSKISRLFSRRFPFDPFPIDIALFEVPAAIIDRFFSAEAVYADDKAIPRSGFDEGAAFSRFLRSRFLYFPMLPFLLHILFSRWKPAFILKNCISRVVPE
jgi:hypothetical protein